MVTGKRFVLIMILYTSQKSTIDIVFFPFFRVWKQVFLELFFPFKKLMFHLLRHCFKGISEYRLRSFNRSAQVTTASVCKILSILSNPES